MKCRLMEPGDEQQVLSLVERGFDQFVRCDCTPGGTEEFLRATRRMILDRPDNHVLLVAETDGRLVGMIDVKDNSHVSLFFVASAYHHRGIGRRLLDHAITECLSAGPDLRDITVNSSVWAVPIYERLGFRQSAPEQVINGIRFVAMTRPLRNDLQPE